MLNSIQEDPRFTLSWMSLSLTANEVQRRVEYLAELIEREERRDLQDSSPMMTSKKHSQVEIQSKMEEKQLLTLARADKESLVQADKQERGL